MKIRNLVSDDYVKANFAFLKLLIMDSIFVLDFHRKCYKQQFNLPYYNARNEK